MNNMLIAAIVGFLFVEGAAVNRSVRQQPGNFDVLYYLKNNWILLVLNALGTFLMYMCAPFVLVLLRWFIGRWIEDPSTVEFLGDSVMLPVTGGFVGLLGAYVVRRFQRWIKDKFGPDDDADNNTPVDVQGL